MSRRKPNRTVAYLLGSLFAVLTAGCLGALTYLLLATVLPEFEIPTVEANQVAIGVGLLIGLLLLLVQLRCYAMRRRLRPRQMPFRPETAPAPEAKSR